MKVRERVRLHLKTKRTLEGVLLSKRRGVYELGDCRVEDEHGKLQKAAGVVFVDRVDVEFAQGGWAS
jgi:hypothetical protein